MKQHVMAVLWMMMAICISGCAQSLPPHEELNQAMKKSFDATGLNFSLQNKITHLSLPKQDTSDDDSEDNLSKYLETGLEIIRGFSVNADGAIDTKTKRSEVLYDLRYDKDNVDVSVKIPLLVDYNTQTIFVGTTLFNTFLETLYPQAPATKGKLVRINIQELLKENSADVPELAKLLNTNSFNSKNIDLISNAVKAGVLKSLAKLKDTCFSDQPLTEQDRKAGVERRIRVDISHKDSVAIVVDLVDGVSLALFQDGVISKDEYAVLLSLTDKQTLDGFIDKFTMTMIFDVGIAQSGLVSRMESQLNIADKEGNYQLGLGNVSSFSSYNAPHFSIIPEASEIVDFKEVMNAIKKDTEKGQQSSQPGVDDSDDSEDTGDTTQGDSKAM
jgi:hypothetical protein